MGTPLGVSFQELFPEGCLHLERVSAFSPWTSGHSVRNLRPVPLAAQTGVSVQGSSESGIYEPSGRISHSEPCWFLTSHPPEGRRGLWSRPGHCVRAMEVSPRAPEAVVPVYLLGMTGFSAPLPLASSSFCNQVVNLSSHSPSGLPGGQLESPRLQAASAVSLWKCVFHFPLCPAP